MSMTWLGRFLGPGLRFLVGNPGLSAVAVITLALGIGANTAIFSVSYATLLNPLPWGDAERVVRLAELKLAEDDADHEVVAAKYRDWVAQAQSFEGLAAFELFVPSLNDVDSATLITGYSVTPEAFSLFGVRPLLGRALQPEDATPGAERVALMSHGLWRRTFGEDPSLVGRTILEDGQPLRIVGVLPPGVWFPMLGSELIRPLRIDPSADRTIHTLQVIGLLKRNSSLASARTEMDLISARLTAANPGTDEGWTVRVGRLRDELYGGPLRVGLSILGMAVGMVLLIACANVANLLLARAASRQREIAIRAAVGASRRQIVTHLLGECAALALPAFPVAMFAAWAALRYCRGIVPPSVVSLEFLFQINGAVLLFATALTFASVLISGLMPALHASKVDLRSQLHEGGDRGGTHRRGKRLRSGLVVAQIALAMALLLGAALLIDAFNRVQRTDPGFDVANLLTASVRLPSARYPEPEQWRSFADGLREGLARRPEVKSVSVVTHPPFGIMRWGRRARSAEASSEDSVDVSCAQAGASYHDTIGLPVLRGRGFLDTDQAASPRVAVLNATAAGRLFPSGDALGKRIVFDDDREPWEVVGVTADIQAAGLGVPGNDAHIQVPFAQQPGWVFSVVVRARAGQDRIEAALREEIRNLDSNVNPFVTTMTRRIESGQFTVRFLTDLMTLMGAIGLVLAAIGVYGVITYSTALRTREFGIRTSLGARPREVAMLVLREASVLTGLGMGIGLMLALVEARVLRALIYQIGPSLSGPFLVVAGILIAIVLIATLLPTWRAARIDPMIALRAE